MKITIYGWSTRRFPEAQVHTEGEACKERQPFKSASNVWVGRDGKYDVQEPNPEHRRNGE
jgi:hypothetical protein